MVVVQPHNLIPVGVEAPFFATAETERVAYRFGPVGELGQPFGILGIGPGGCNFVQDVFLAILDMDHLEQTCDRLEAVEGTRRRQTLGLKSGQAGLGIGGTSGIKQDFDRVPKGTLDAQGKRGDGALGQFPADDLREGFPPP